MSETFRESPARRAGLRDERVALSFDLAAWRYLARQKARGEYARNRELALMISMAMAGREIPALPPDEGEAGAAGGTVLITVGGQKRRVPAPPPGSYYGPDGVLISPQANRRVL